MLASFKYNLATNTAVGGHALRTCTIRGRDGPELIRAALLVETGSCFACRFSEKNSA
jgi:hypothetical protein